MKKDPAVTVETTVGGAAGLRSGDRVALIGSGGKTTLLYRLGREGPGRVILTTTTRMFPPEPGEVEAFLEYRGWEEFLARWRSLRPRTALVARPDEGGKLAGLAPEEVDALARLEEVDLLVVEADGSRRLPAKGHAPHEPVLFGACTVGLAVLGLDALHRPIAEGSVHRPEVVAAVTGRALGEPLEPGSLARLLAGRGGYLDHLPVLRRVVVLTQVDGPIEAEAARSIAAEVAREARVPVLGLGRALAGGLEVLA